MAGVNESDAEPFTLHTARWLRVQQAIIWLQRLRQDPFFLLTFFFSHAFYNYYCLEVLDGTTGAV